MMRFEVICRALVLVSLCLVGLAGCEQPQTPEEALEALIQAVYTNDGKSAWEYLPQEEQKILSAKADKINAKAGDKGAVEPHELISSSGFVAPYAIARIERTDEQAINDGLLKVKVHTQDKKEIPVLMLNQSGGWKVSIGLYYDTDGNVRKTP